VTIRCETEDGVVDVIRVNPLTGGASLLSVSPIRSGSVDVRPNEFKIVFEATADTWGLWIRVNRYTGEAEREHGTAPFGSLTLDSKNVFQLASCERYEEAQLL
jgi:hypothetical protein